jgi:hypothetical protein
MVAYQVMDGLGGPPSPARRLSGGQWLFPGCEAHDCPNKSVLVLTPDGRILAVGLLSSRCGDDCDITTRHLDVFALDEAVRLGLPNAMEQWAKDVTASDTKEFGATITPTFAGMQLHSCGASCATQPRGRRGGR